MKKKFCRLCLKFLPLIILASSFSFYPYQKDERALPGYLLTRRSFSLSPRYKAPLAFPQMFSLYVYSYTILPDSVFRLQRVNYASGDEDVWRSEGVPPRILKRGR
jgi:hypothetical protein